MYVQVWNHWACWCQCHSYPPAEAPLSLVLDYLHASDFRSSQTKEGFQTFKKNQNDDPYQSTTLGGSKIGPSCTHSLTESQTVADFLKSQTRIPFERSQATPIPLAVLAAWEQRILSDDSSLPEIIALGCFLIATMASLRFRDFLRTKPETLSIQGHILRGISWRTKTSVSGLGSLLSRHFHSSFCEALTKVVITGAPSGHQISFSLMDRRNPLLFTLFLPSRSCFDSILHPMQLANTAVIDSRTVHTQYEIDFTCSCWTTQL